MDATEPVNILNNPTTWAMELVSQSFHSFLQFLPDLLLATAQLLLGLAAAWVIRLIIMRFERGLNHLLSTFQLGNALSETEHNWPIAAIIGNIAFWVTIAFSLVAASKTLQLVFLANWLQELISYLPNLLISAAILFIGHLIGRGLRPLILGYANAQNFQHGSLIAQLVVGLVWVFALILSLSQLGLEFDLLQDIILLAFAAFFGGTALAFGLGAADSVRNIMASHYIRHQYQPGLYVKLDQLEGEILELTPVAVLLDTHDGEVFIPARIFMEQASIVFEPEEIDED